MHVSSLPGRFGRVCCSGTGHHHMMHAPVLPPVLPPHTPRWPLDVACDASLTGQLPSLVLPGFSQPQPYPLVITQQATPAKGAGWMVHVYLDPAEAADMAGIVEAAGGL